MSGTRGARRLRAAGLRARPLAGPGLLVAGLVTLAAAGLRPDLPYGVSFDLARHAWSAPPRERIWFAPMFAARRPFVEAVRRADASWPLERDVVLVLDRDTNLSEASELQRIASYLLAPRRVSVALEVNGRTRLVPVPKGGATR